MKTAVSLPDELFHAAEGTAHRLGVSRSELYKRAIEAFLQQQEDSAVTERLNEIYSENEAEVDEVLHLAQLKSLGDDGW
jgi:metal-responsive CopG/Arc/MetJ family transcriptional regulator